MLFNSYIFILVFLPVTLTGYFALNRFGRFTLGKTWLVLASFVFYAYFNPAYLPIIVVSILGNYALSQCMLTTPRMALRRLCLAVGLAANLGVLGYYKYYDFFVTNLNAAFGSDFVLHHLILPLGISFFTFQQLSYVIDSYKRTVPRYRFIDYALFVTFFPQLIAGPILLHDEVVPQFANPENRRFRTENFAPGLYAFALGLAKKVLIADTFAKVAEFGFLPGVVLNAGEAFFVVLGFTLQLYFDFSGYCDMALGLGKMFNIDIAINFNSPYKSLNIKEFWARWHMTLSRFFSPYVYIPLGGSRKGAARTLFNLMVVFLASGLWHGAGWLFVLWGLLHGLASVGYRLCQKRYDRLNPAFQWLLTFTFVSLAWVFFRAATLDSALQIFGSLFSMRFGPISDNLVKAFWAPFDLMRPIAAYAMPAWYAVAVSVVLAAPNTYELTARFRPTVRTLLVTFVLLALSVLSLSGVSVFLYYNF